MRIVHRVNTALEAGAQVHLLIEGNWIAVLKIQTDDDDAFRLLSDGERDYAIYPNDAVRGIKARWPTNFSFYPAPDEGAGDGSLAY